MSKYIKTILERVRHWAPEQQREAVETLLLIGEQNQSPFHLTDEQLAELRRRRFDKDAKPLTLEELVRA